MLGHFSLTPYKKKEPDGRNEPEVVSDIVTGVLRHSGARKHVLVGIAQSISSNSILLKHIPFDSQSSRKPTKPGQLLPFAWEEKLGPERSLLGHT